MPATVPWLDLHLLFGVQGRENAMAARLVNLVIERGGGQ
jgi:hypothetical protein